MYYRKTYNGQDIADRCGVGDIYARIGSKIHHDDMRDVAALLDLTPSGMDLLFELEDGDDYPQELNFEPYDDGKLY